MRHNQSIIINELNTRSTIDPGYEIAERSQFLADYLAHTSLNGFVLGISGGQDSLLAGLLAKQAVKLRRDQGFEATFHGALLPYGTQIDRADAELAVATIDPDVVHDLDITSGVDSFTAAFATSEAQPIRDFDKGNVKARMRMIAQYAIASHYNLLVIGTDHAAEAVTGFYTKFGDGGADVVPLAGLTKRQGRAMLQTLAVPDIFLTKPPTADLLDARPGQTDEAELGLSYQLIDDYLEGKTVPDGDAEAIEERFRSSWHKRVVPVAYRSDRYDGLDL